MKDMGKGKGKKMAKCDSYHRHGMKFLCYGTKAMEECSCGGDTSKCNFYPEKRKPNTQKMATEKRLIDAMQTVTKMSGRVRPLIQMCANPVQVYNEVLQVLGEAPTVDAVQVVHGEWKPYGKNFYAYYYKCSVCGEIHDGKKNYCHNCGAKMDGERKDK